MLLFSSAVITNSGSNPTRDVAIGCAIADVTSQRKVVRILVKGNVVQRLTALVHRSVTVNAEATSCKRRNASGTIVASKEVIGIRRER